MPIMRIQKRNELSPEVQELFERAKNRDIDLPTFFKTLETNQITGFVKAIYASQAFGISLSEAKKAFVEDEHGSLEEWESQFDGVIEEIQNEVRDVGEGGS